MLGVELLHGRARRKAALALVPALEGLQRHDAVHQHENRAERGEGVARLPGDEVDELQEPRQAELDPHKAERAPHAHEEGARTAGKEDRDGVREEPENREARVVPCHGAKANLHEPRDRRLEEPADHGGHEEDHDGVSLVEAVERDGHEHGAKPVDGGEGPIEHAGAVLVDSGVHHDHVIHGLDDEPEHAADHEDPEQVEEVELNEAAVALGASERAVLGGLLGLQVTELSLQAALGDERGVDGGRAAPRRR